MNIGSSRFIIAPISPCTGPVAVLAYRQGGQLPIPKFLVPLIREGGGNEEYFSQLKPNYKSTVAHTKM